MKKYFYRTGILISVALASYFVCFSIDAIRQYEIRIFLTPDLMLAIAAATFLYAICMPISGWAWHILLRGMGATWQSGNLSSIMGITQLAKYIPGNIGQHVGRTALSLAKGMSVGNYTGSVLIETVLAMLAGLFVGVLFALLSPLSVSHILFEYRAILGMAAIPLALCALALPWIIHNLKNFVRNRAFSSKLEKMNLTLPGCNAISLAFSGYCINYALIGLGLWLISLAVGDGIKIDYFYLTSAFAFSWLIGFITPGAPAGIGVREGIMVLLLSGLASGDIVLLIVATMRIATIAGDGLVFIISAIYIRLNPFENEK
ncbi:MAG: lysylphosphatidylglycerol synthase domain-containing protein [Azovibrio sp.]|uniref:lysylphosphatidylglycerol synthase domain-containing protein n=1 Tax=Azovibrio sp. TaxID=1872673 RepID=UPI003C70B1B6